MEGRAQQLSGLLGLAGLLLGAVQNFTGLSALLNENFWPIFVLALMMSLYSFWPDPVETNHLRIVPLEKQSWQLTMKRFLKIGLVIAFAAAIGGHHVWDLYRTVPGKHPYPKPQIPIGINFDSLLVGTAKAADSTAPQLILFGLQRSKTSFEENIQSLHAAGRRIRTFSLSYDEMNFIWQGQCTPEFQLRELLVRKSLVKFANENGRAQLVQHVPESTGSLSTVVKQRPDITQKFLPTKDEWGKMPSGMRDDILFWIRSCIGIPYPVFILTVENKRDSNLVVTAIVYKVKSVGGVKGGESGPLGPKVTYIHKLEYKTGEQRHILEQPFHVTAKGASSFGLQLWTDHPDLGMTWEMTIQLQTNQGPIETESFQLIMSGQPKWADQKFK